MSSRAQLIDFVIDICANACIYTYIYIFSSNWSSVAFLVILPCIHHPWQRYLAVDVTACPRSTNPPESRVTCFQLRRRLPPRVGKSDYPRLTSAHAQAHAHALNMIIIHYFDAYTASDRDWG